MTEFGFIDRARNPRGVLASMKRTNYSTPVLKMNGLFSNFAARIAFFLSRPKSDRINFSTSDSEVKIKAKVISSSKIKVVNLQGLCGIKLIEEDDIKGAWMIQEKKEAKYSDRREI